jgi:hypothetical protein
MMQGNIKQRGLIVSPFTIDCLRLPHHTLRSTEEEKDECHIVGYEPKRSLSLKISLMIQMN